MRRETFFVGGSYAGQGLGQVMHGQMYVEAMWPDVVSRPYPLVMFHGGGQTAATWLTTPDGRPGWADWFVEQGWRVILVDQPGRGRSAWQPGVNAALTPASVGFVESVFTAPAEYGLWPQARLHTQWPGKGQAGDPVFDQFYASQVPSLPRRETEQTMVQAGAALLDRIGPSVLIVHSQAGSFAWSTTEARPGLVKGIVALEPTGPPYKDASPRADAEDRHFGLTCEKLTYDPPVTEKSPLSFEQAISAEGPDLVACWAQSGTPRKLVNLLNVPTMVLTSEASYHAAYDHCTANYLRQAGVNVDFVRLQDRGLQGNGHMMMLEKNSLDVASIVNDWLVSTVT